MKVLAMCCQEFRWGMRKVAGVEPVLAPPIRLETFKPVFLEGYGLLMFKLHGLIDQPFWYGTGWTTAMGAEQVRRADLKGVMVFAMCCYTPESPMLEAFLDAGASVIAGRGENLARRRGVHGVDLLGRAFRQVYTSTRRPWMSLHLAKMRVRAAGLDRTGRDALGFRLYERIGSHGS